jgi:hypothetical protein
MCGGGSWGAYFDTSADVEEKVSDLGALEDGLSLEEVPAVFAVGRRRHQDAVVKSYICQWCSFETYSVLMWIKHFDGSCFMTKEEYGNVSEEEWYRCECCSFKTKEATVFEKHHTTKQLLHYLQWYNCDKCEFKTKPLPKTT